MFSLHWVMGLSPWLISEQMRSVIVGIRSIFLLMLFLIYTFSARLFGGFFFPSFFFFANHFLLRI
jgi:hypothetical protein